MYLFIAIEKLQLLSKNDASCLKTHSLLENTARRGPGYEGNAFLVSKMK